MKSMLALAGLMLCASCGPSDIERNNAELQNLLDAKNVTEAEIDREAARAADQRRQCEEKARAARVANDEKIASDDTMIKLALSGIDRSARNDTGAARYMLQVDIEKLGADGWVWREREGAAANAEDVAAGLVTRLTYSADPADLSPSVGVSKYAGMPAITFKCLSGDCIRVVGSQTVFRDGEEKMSDIDEKRSSNSWVLDNEGKASALARTMTDMLTLIAANNVVTDCGTATGD